MTSIYIIDEHKIVKDSVALTLTKSNRYRVVGCACDYKKCIFKIAQIKPDIILIDHNQITFNGFDCISEIKKKCLQLL
jgi:DNA-binding NarL/FixJ family response regulator